MAKNDSSAQVVSDLLAERKKLEEWLAKLDATAADASRAGVADKVRADYRKRLDEVTAELGEHEDGMQKERDRRAADLEKLRAEEGSKTEELAEAELRHTVGEYTEAQWKEKKAAVTGKLEGIRTSLAETEAAIAALDEVLGNIAGREAPAEEPAPPARTGKAGKEKKKPQTEAFGDEMAFLKSVSDDEEKGPSPKRASGAQRIPDEAEAEPKSAAPLSVEKEAGGPVVRASRPSIVNQRTLKCRECGSMNLPTEWYCEKCGAELAAV